MTIQAKEIGIELSQLKSEEVAMPLRICTYCKGLSNFDVGSVVAGGSLTGYASLDMCQNCGTFSYFVVTAAEYRDAILDRYPKVQDEPDKELPDDVKVAFSEAIKSLNGGIWDGCVVMCRRALEEAMSDLGAEGVDLFNKIDDIESKRKITPELKEWAHEGRLAGKLGAHGTKQKRWADKDDAEAILEFCRWFFRYVYVLPKQLAERKHRLAEQVDKEKD